MDVIDVVDATYIVMERIDGPELTDFIEMQPLCRIDAPLYATQGSNHPRRAGSVAGRASSATQVV